MNGASRWLDACVGLVQVTASAAANKAGASALASAGYFTVAANMGSLLAESSVGCGVDSLRSAGSLPSDRRDHMGGRPETSRGAVYVMAGGLDAPRMLAPPPGLENFVVAVENLKSLRRGVGRASTGLGRDSQRRTDSDG